MDPGGKRFGRGPRELTGGVDLINRYKLLAHHDFFCKRSLPLSLLDANYLHDIVGDADIRKGEGMQLDELVRNFHASDTNARIQQFDLGALLDAFRLQESAPIDLPLGEKGVPTVASKSRTGSGYKERKHRKKKDKGNGKEHKKKHKHRHKDKSNDKEKDDDRTGRCDSNIDHSKRPHEKKRNLDGDGGVGDSNGHKKNKKLMFVAPAQGFARLGR